MKSNFVECHDCDKFTHVKCVSYVYDEENIECNPPNQMMQQMIVSHQLNLPRKILQDFMHCQEAFSVEDESPVQQEIYV